MDNLFLLLFFASIIVLIVGLIKPTIFARFLKERATRKGVAMVFGIATFVFFILFTITVDTDTTTARQEAMEREVPEVSTAEALTYEIVQEEDNSMKALGNKLLSEYTSKEIENLPTAKRMSYRILVSPEIKENQVRPTVEKIVSDISSRNNEIDSIHLLLYSDRELIEGSYDVAMAIWAPGGEVKNITPEIARSNNRTGYEISLTIRQNLEGYLKSRAESEDKFELSETERRQIFKEIVAAEDRAMDEADKLFPIEVPGNLDKNIDKMRELEELYKSQIIEKYGITEEALSEIGVEGAMKRWPME